MAGLRISPKQAGALSDDVVRRHALALAQQADARMRMQQAVPENSPSALARLAALHAALWADLDTNCGAAAEYLAVDLDHCAAQLALALQAGAVYREPAAAALMSAATALGALWLGDERLCIDRRDKGDKGDEGENDKPVLRLLPQPHEPDELCAWAQASWASRFQLASQRSRELLAPTRYAMGRAIALGFNAESLRSLADAVFEPDEVAVLSRFLVEERGQLAIAGLGGRSLGDQRIEVLCIAADLVFGLGRFVRLATTALAKARSLTAPGEQAHGASIADIEPLLNHLRKALHALAEQPEQ